MTDNLPATVTEDYGTGLEDLSPDEVQIPRIKIDHPNAVFKDGLTGEEFAEMHGIVLGMVKQRVMFRPTMDEGSPKPRCKSNDAKTGLPNMDSTDPEDLFPWGESGLNPSLMPKDEYGRIVVPCDTCPFAEWGGTRQKPKPPPCNELHTFPIMYATEKGAPIDRAGIITFKGSGIKPGKMYMSAFVRMKKPLYSVYTTIKLKLNKRGMVVYSTPEFAKFGEVPQEEWPQWAAEYTGLREFLRRPPRPSEEMEAGVGGIHTGGSAGSMPASQPTPQAQAPAQATPHIPAQRTASSATPPAPAPSPQASSASIIDSVATSTPASPPPDDDDDLPF